MVPVYSVTFNIKFSSLAKQACKMHAGVTKKSPVSTNIFPKAKNPAVQDNAIIRANTLIAIDSSVNEIQKYLDVRLSQIAWNDLKKPLMDSIIAALDTEIPKTIESSNPELAKTLKGLTKVEKEAIAQVTASALLDYVKAIRNAFSDALTNILTKDIPQLFGALLQEVRTGTPINRAVKKLKNALIAAVRQGVSMAIDSIEAAFNNLAPDGFFDALTNAIETLLPGLASSFTSVEGVLRPILTKIVSGLIAKVFDLIRSNIGADVADIDIEEIFSNTVRMIEGFNKGMLP
ncbi:hypothetical protein BDF19DRAFT_429985 [Syncephalis fuscata]|nr:hypothetical protein BDF19DRAFT_429985 [Syncephalis fuscata]